MFFLHLRAPAREEVRAELGTPRSERAVGVVYRPDTELQSGRTARVSSNQMKGLGGGQRPGLGRGDSIAPG
jgi:hypothetical protein